MLRTVIERVVLLTAYFTIFLMYLILAFCFLAGLLILFGFIV